LLNFVGKILNARSIHSQPPEREAARRLADEIGALAAPEMADGLFKKENFEAYVTPDYEKSLKQLVRLQAPSEAADENPFDVQCHLKTFNDDHLAEHIAEVAVALLTGHLDADLYQEVAEQLVRLARDLAKKPHLSLLIKIQQLFLNHSRTEPPSANCAAARAALEQLSDPRCIRALRASLENSGCWADPAAVAFFFTLGPHVVPEALHLYLYRTELQREEWLAALIDRYPQHLLKEVIKRLQLNLGAHLVEFLAIFEKLRDPTCIPSVRPFLRHPDDGARLGALKVLLNFNDEEGVAHLRKLLASKKNQEFLAGLDLAEKYEVVGVAGDLAKRLKKRFLLYRSDVIRNERILSALENFGYRMPASNLEQLNRIRFSFYPKGLARMKMVVSNLLLKQTPLLETDRMKHPTCLGDASLGHDAASR
jgi:hypothetical protein